MNTTTASNPRAKFAPFALFLGCSAIAFTWAVQSEPVEFVPAVRHAATAIGFELPRITHRVMSFMGPQRPLQLATSEVLRLIGISAEKHNVPAAFVKSIVAAESAFNSEALSSKGAMGLMQVMPETAKEYGDNPSIPEQNVDAGTHYLRALMNRYDRFGEKSLPRVIAAYNAGPGNVDRYRGIPPFRETRTYVVRVLSFLRKFRG